MVQAVWYVRFHDLTSVSALNTFAGDVVYVEALGTSIVILGSDQAASDLFEKRSAIYSDRPRFPTVEL